MPYTINNRSGHPLVTVESADNLRDAVIWATKHNVSLARADLRWSDLSGSDLRGSDLSGSNLRGSDLRWSNLSGSTINWQSHDMLAEILLRAAGDDVEKRMVAGLIAVSTDWCWDRFLGIEHPQKQWAIAELAKWAKPGVSTPQEIKNAAKLAEASA